MRRIDWLKVFANFGVAFFSTLMSLFTANSLWELDIPLGMFVLSSIIVAFINGSLSFFKEILKCIESNKGMMIIFDKNYQKKKNYYNLVNKLVLL